MRWELALIALMGLGIMANLTAHAATAGRPGAGDLVIAADGRSDAMVVVSPEAGPDEKLAAEDLAKYIEMMSGARPAIADTPEAIQEALASNAPLMIVGEEALKAKPALKDRLAEVRKPEPILGADAIALLREGNRVYLAGTDDQAHYFAVAELLWRWGCRWYIPTEIGECIPEEKTLTVGELDYAYGSPFEMRGYWISWVGDNTGRPEFQKRNMMVGGRGFPPAGHALDGYTRDAPGSQGTFNFPITAPETAEHVAGKMEEAFAKGQGISIGMADGLYSSDYPKDQELMKLQWDKYFMRWSVTDPMLELYNNVARILQEKHPDSDGKLGFLIYSNMTIPPVRDMTAERSLFGMLAPIDIDPIHGMDDLQSPPRQEYRDMMYAWAKVMQGRLCIYDYDQGMLVWRDIPNPSHQSFRQDVKHYRDAGILGVSTESRNAIATTFLNLYVRARLLWNPDEDVDALLADFYPRFYGPAAEPMSVYWNTIFRAWEQTICTEHEYFVAPAIYTPQVMDVLAEKIEEAEQIINALQAEHRIFTRNEQLYVDRMEFTRTSFEILDAYMAMVKAAATDVDYAAAAAAGDRGLKARDAMTALHGIFTTTRLEGEGYPWWPGEVRQYRELLDYTDGTKGRLMMKLPLEWAFRRDPDNVGLQRGYHTQPVDLGYWEANARNYTLDGFKDYPDAWEMLSTDLYVQAQGVRHPDRQSFVGHAWYRTDVNPAGEEAAADVHIRFPGLFNECWLYVNGEEVGHREQGVLWWLNDYRFEWDVDLTGRLKPGVNTIALRANCVHHFGGMFRRPFLYQPTLLPPG